MTIAAIGRVLDKSCSDSAHAPDTKNFYSINISTVLSQK